MRISTLSYFFTMIAKTAFIWEQKVLDVEDFARNAIYKKFA